MGYFLGFLNLFPFDMIFTSHSLVILNQIFCGFKDSLKMWQPPEIVNMRGKKKTKHFLLISLKHIWLLIAKLKTLYRIVYKYLDTKH